jgi:archaellum component FlaC
MDAAACPADNETALAVTRVVNAAELDEGPASLHRSAQLAEIKVMIETLDQRSSEMMSTVNQRIDDLQSHLPRFIDVKVTSRIREVEERLRSEFQDEQSKTLDAFLRTLEQKVLPRLTLVEDAVGAHGAEIGEMRQRIQKTDETLDRVLERIEKVVDSVSLPFSEYANSHVTAIHQKAVA